MSKKENLTKWVAWLRDPANQQDKGHLRTAKGSCCLGGACDVYRDDTGNGMWELRQLYSLRPATPGQEVFVFVPFIGSEKYSAFPPEEVVAYFSLNDNNPTFKVDINSLNSVHVSDYDVTDGYALVTASGLNDDHRWTFVQIAAVIEAQLINADGDGSTASAQCMTPFRLSE